MNHSKRSVSKKISSNLKRLLEHHSISYRQLGISINAQHVHLYKIANNHYSSPGIEIVKKIADFFNISILQLIGEQEIDFKNRPKNLNLEVDEN